MVEFILACALVGFAFVSFAEHPLPSAVAAGSAIGLLVSAMVRHMAAKLRREASISAHFSPRGGCVTIIVQALGRAQREVLVQAYSFTCPDIAKALIAAAGRGITVRVLLDRSNEVETYSELGDIEGHGIEILIDSQHAIAHNKIMIIDGETVLTGSFNFTRQAEHNNAENLVVLMGHREIAARYRENFFVHHAHSQKPSPKPGKVLAHQGR